jgi:hypothetical protein
MSSASSLGPTECSDDSYPGCVRRQETAHHALLHFEVPLGILIPVPIWPIDWPLSRLIFGCSSAQALPAHLGCGPHGEKFRCHSTQSRPVPGVSSVGMRTDQTRSHLDGVIVGTEPHRRTPSSGNARIVSLLCWGAGEARFCGELLPTSSFQLATTMPAHGCGYEVCMSAKGIAKHGAPVTHSDKNKP